MRKLVVPVAALVLLVLVPAPARAQSYIAPFYGWDFGGDAGTCPSFLNDCAEKKTSWGVTLGKGGVVGFEEDISYAPNFFGESASLGSNSVLTLMTNLSVGFPSGPVRPYISGGIGLIRTNVEINVSSLLSFDNSAFGYDIGGGVNFVFPHHLGLRFDYRHFTSTGTIPILSYLGVSTSQKLSFSRFAIGLLLH